MTAIELAPVLVEQTGSVRWIRLNRPRARNALNPELIAALDVAIAAAMADEETRIVVIAGAGPSFCAGADLRHLLALARSGEDPAAFLASISDCFSRIERAAKPVVAAVHGHVVAGGLELALVCDAVVARSGTLIGDGHVRQGLLPGAGASLRLPRKVGEPFARWLMLTGELVAVERFLATGFVCSVVPPEEFEGQVEAVAARLLAAGDGTHARVKELLAHRPDTDDALVRELRTFGEHWREHGVAASLTEFVERGRKG